MGLVWYGDWKATILFTFVFILLFHFATLCCDSLSGGEQRVISCLAPDSTTWRGKWKEMVITQRLTHSHTHLLPACPPHAVHRAIQAWQFRAELKWRERPKIVRQGEREGRAEKRRSREWLVEWWGTDVIYRQRQGSDVIFWMQFVCVSAHMCLSAWCVLWNNADAKEALGWRTHQCRGTKKHLILALRYLGRQKLMQVFMI